MASFRHSTSPVFKLGLILLIINPLQAIEGDSQTLFRKVNKGYRLTSNIISEYKVPSWLDCALYCLQYAYETLCVCFNYKSSIQNEETNCQLTVAEQHPDGVTLVEAKDWTFYTKEQIEDPCVKNPCRTGTCKADKYIRAGFTCECNIFITGERCDMCKDPSHNFALGKPTNQSSTYINHVSHLAVDGNKGTHYRPSGKAQCARTYDANHDWWRVEFTETILVARVAFINRGDGYWGRMRDFEIKVGDSLVDNGLANPKCGDRHSAGQGETLDITCTPIMFGRYLVIQSQLNKPMDFCEVEVYCQ